jgi:two-component system OmpR family sensor kinase
MAWAGNPPKAHTHPQVINVRVLLIDRRSTNLAGGTWLQNRNIGTKLTHLSQTIAGKPVVAVAPAESEAMENLRRQLAEMAVAVAARDTFISVAAHELRNPLTPLVGHVDLLLASLRAGRCSMEQVEHRMERIQYTLRRYMKRVSILLDVSRMTTEKLCLNPEPCDLAALMREVTDEFAEAANRVGVTITVTAPESLPGTWDPLSLEQIIDNLLSNALKYGGRTTVELSATVHGEQVRLQVRDHGQGIAADARARVFERFERVIGQREPASGFGIGLWVVAQHVEAMQGRITIDDSPGGGALFTVTLPLHVQGKDL